MRPILATVTEGDPSLPLGEILKAYKDLAYGRTPKRIRWDPSRIVDGLDEVTMGETAATVVELFDAAILGLKALTAKAALNVLSASLELLEAEAYRGSGPSNDISVDSGDPPMVVAERLNQLADLGVLIEASPNDQQSVVRVLRRSAEAAKQVNGRVPVAAQPRAKSRPPNDRTRELLSLLRNLDAHERDTVANCAQKVVNSRSTLQSAKTAMQAVGIHRAHELFESTDRVLSIEAQGALWEVSSWAVIAAEAWDNLAIDDRANLLECLAVLPQIRRAIRRWR